MTETPADRVEAVKTVNQAFYMAVESGDMDTMEAIWLNGPADPTVTCIHPGSPPIHGRSEVLRSFAVVMASTPYIQFILTDVRVAVARDVAVVTCTENVLTSGEAKGAVFAAGRAVATKVLLRVDGSWRIWQHHASPIVETRRSEP